VTSTARRAAAPRKPDWPAATSTARSDPVPPAGAPSIVTSPRGRLLSHSRAAPRRHDRRVPRERAGDLGNVVPVVLSWIAQEVDGEISAAMLQLALEWRQALVLDPCTSVSWGCTGCAPGRGPGRSVKTWGRPSGWRSSSRSPSPASSRRASTHGRCSGCSCPGTRATGWRPAGHGRGRRRGGPQLPGAAARRADPRHRRVASGHVGNLESETSLRGLVWHTPSGSRGSSHRR